MAKLKKLELSRINKISGANLHRNWVIIPHVTHFDKADITDLEAFRKEQNALAEKQKLGVKNHASCVHYESGGKSIRSVSTFQ